MSIRSFIAIELDDVIATQLDKLCQRFRNHFALDDKSIKWVRPDQIHLTLKFLGDVEDKLIPSICEAISRTASEFEPFEFQIDSCGCFPPHGSARVLWAGLTEKHQLLHTLHQSLDTHLQALGFAGDSRLFTAHLTLARIKNSKTGRLTQNVLKDIGPVSLPSQWVNQLTLFHSQLSRQGPQHTPMHHAPLGNPALPS